MEQNWEDFINAIVLQAFKDLRWARRRLMRHPGDLKAIWMIEDVEHFLLSQWCEMLTGIDGEYIFRKFKERL